MNMEITQWTYAWNRLRPFAPPLSLGFILLIALGWFVDLASRQNGRRRGVLSVFFAVNFAMSAWSARHGGGGPYY